MTVQVPQSLSVLLVAISVVFIGIVIQDFLKKEKKMTIARKIWLRMAFIFVGLGLVLFFYQTFFL